MKKSRTYILKEQNPISFKIAGIVTHEKIYVVSNRLNQLHSTGFGQLKLTGVEGTDRIYSLNSFSYVSKYSDNLISLISNKMHDGVFMSRFKTIDYFLIISGYNTEAEDDILVESIKNAKTFLSFLLIGNLTGKERALFQQLVNLLWAQNK